MNINVDRMNRYINSVKEWSVGNDISSTVDWNDGVDGSTVEFVFSEFEQKYSDMSNNTYRDFCRLKFRIMSRVRSNKRITFYSLVENLYKFYKTNIELR